MNCLSSWSFAEPKINSKDQRGVESEIQYGVKKTNGDSRPPADPMAKAKMRTPASRVFDARFIDFKLPFFPAIVNATDATILAAHHNINQPQPRRTGRQLRRRTDLPVRAAPHRFSWAKPKTTSREREVSSFKEILLIFVPNFSCQTTTS